MLFNAGLVKSQHSDICTSVRVSQTAKDSQRDKIVYLLKSMAGDTISEQIIYLARHYRGEAQSSSGVNVTR